MKNYQNARILHDFCPKNIFPDFFGPPTLPPVSYAYEIREGYGLGPAMHGVGWVGLHLLGMGRILLDISWVELFGFGQIVLFVIPNYS